MREVEMAMRTGFRSIWLQRPDRWTFFGSMFFCCTVFTTVGRPPQPDSVCVCVCVT